MGGLVSWFFEILQEFEKKEIIMNPIYVQSDVDKAKKATFYFNWPTNLTDSAEGRLPECTKLYETLFS